MNPGYENISEKPSVSLLMAKPQGSTIITVNR